MGIYQQESVSILHEAADQVIDKYHLKGEILAAFMNGVYSLEYAFNLGLGEKRRIKDTFAHIITFDSIKLARTPLLELQSLLLK